MKRRKAFFEIELDPVDAARAKFLCERKGLPFPSGLSFLIKEVVQPADADRASSPRVGGSRQNGRPRAGKSVVGKPEVGKPGASGKKGVSAK